MIAGRKGWLDKELFGQIAKGEAAGQVLWLGFVPDDCMCGLYSGATALIQPSIYEGFGMPVLEAQLCGTPAMVADIPSLNEAAGGAATRFRPDFEGICDVLIQLAKGELVMVRRSISDIHNSAAISGTRIWNVFETTMMRRAA
jgi:glycosyltransferase involved in cell wall biosynthesis